MGKRAFFEFVVGEDKSSRPIFKPYGITAAPGKVYICDNGSRTVDIAEYAKRRMSYFIPMGDATLGCPINIAVDGDGTRYLTDTKRCQVLVFKDDKYLGAIGTKGEMKPVGVALSTNRVYVTDLEGHGIRVYDKQSRNLLFTFPKDPKDTVSQLFSPTNIAIDKQNHVWVSDTGGFFVKVFDADGKFIRKIGEQGTSPGRFAMPKGIAVDRDCRAYVIDASFQLVQLFDSEGRILLYFGDAPTNQAGGMSLPASVAVDYDNVQYFKGMIAPNFTVEYLIYVTSQTGDRKVSVFGFGHKK